MFRNYLFVSIRNIVSNKLYSLINIFSLAIGLAACGIIYLFIADETSFDSFHQHRADIYRVNETQNFSGTNFQKVALTGGPFGPVMKEEFPEIKNYTRFWGGAKRLMKVGEKQFVMDQVATVDSSFLRIFDFEMLHGDRFTALVEPNTMVLTESAARKFFDNPADAIGEMVSKRNREFKVTGILKDIPENSHLQFDVLESFETYVREDSTMNSDWGGNYLVTYLLLYPQADVAVMQAKFPEWLVRWTGRKDIGDAYTVYLQPLAEVHTLSTDVEHDYQNYRKFNGAYLDVFAVVGVFILLIAAVNFMNLTTARSSYRWKEIGVRTSVGARKLQLFSQFIFESVMLALFALVVAFLLELIFVPFLNDLIGRQLVVAQIFLDPAKLLLVVVCTVAVGILTGIYPSFYMTSVNSARVLKGGVRTGGKSIFQSTLVVLQFGLAVSMIVSTFVVLQQIYFMKNKDIGFDTDQIMLIQLEDRNVKMQDRKPNQQYESMKKELLGISSVAGVTASGQRIGNNFHQWGFKVRGDTGVIQFAPSNVNVDPDYLTVYGIDLVQGRNFSVDNPSDNGKAFIINESLAKYLKLKDPVGTPAGHGWYNSDSLGTIIGVAKDFHFNSLHHSINTLSIVSHRDWDYQEMSIKIHGGHIDEAITDIRRIWEKFTTFPFSYSFLDEHFDNLYRSDQQLSSVVSIMAVLAILISCMGLFGLSVITTEKKTKEIGIRKALGATELGIVMLLSGSFARLILVSFLLACPVTYFFLSEWLKGFAYRIGVNPLLFILGGVVALAIALITISYSTIRLARANPVKALRYE